MYLGDGVGWGEGGGYCNTLFPLQSEILIYYQFSIKS